MCSILYFVKKYWSKLLQAHFPFILTRTYSDSLLLEVVGQCKQKWNDYDILSLHQVVKYCGTLAQMSWLVYKQFKHLKKALESFQADIDFIYQLLLGRKFQMAN